jgi:serine/threonine protein kinase
MTTDSCLDDDVLYVVAEGEDPSPSAAAHLEQCGSCRDRLNRQRSTVTTIRRLFQHQADSDDVATSAFQGPRFVGRYFVAGTLGEDENFAVYRGVHSLLQADVFIYRSKRGIAGDGDSAETLVAECRRLGSVRNDTIARVLDVEIVRGIPSLVIEYVEGARLEEVVQRDNFDAAFVVRLVQSVALALAELHKNGMVHGGLSQSSILVTHDGGAKIVDLGTSQVRQLIRGPEAHKPSTSSSSPSSAPHSAARDSQSKEADVRALGELLDWLLKTEKLKAAAASDRRVMKLQHVANRATSNDAGRITDMPTFAALVGKSLDTIPKWSVIVLCLLSTLVGAAFAYWLFR